MIWCLFSKVFIVILFVIWIVFKFGNGINVILYYIKGGRKYEYYLCYYCILLVFGLYGKFDLEWISSLLLLIILMEEN